MWTNWHKFGFFPFLWVFFLFLRINDCILRMGARLVHYLLLLLFTNSLKMKKNVQFRQRRFFFHFNIFASVMFFKKYFFALLKYLLLYGEINIASEELFFFFGSDDKNLSFWMNEKGGFNLMNACPKHEWIDDDLLQMWMRVWKTFSWDFFRS